MRLPKTQPRSMPPPRARSRLAWIRLSRPRLSPTRLPASPRAQASADGSLAASVIASAAAVSDGAVSDTSAETASVVSVDASNPKNLAVELKAGKPIAKPISLAQIKSNKLFADSPLVRQGRLSVVPLTAAQYKYLAGD